MLHSLSSGPALSLTGPKDQGLGFRVKDNQIIVTQLSKSGCWVWGGSLKPGARQNDAGGRRMQVDKSSGSEEDSRLPYKSF